MARNGNDKIKKDKVQNPLMVTIFFANNLKEILADIRLSGKNCKNMVYLMYLGNLCSQTLISATKSAMPPHFPSGYQRENKSRIKTEEPQAILPQKRLDFCCGGYPVIPIPGSFLLIYHEK